MPYIPSSRRAVIDTHIEELITALGTEDQGPQDGDLNYVITRLLLATIVHEPVRYTKINTALGILTAVEMELYRRMAAHYEDEKASENGDVY